MKYIFLILLVSCGTDPDQNSKPSQITEAKTPVEKAEKQPLQSMAINSRSSLPKCNADIEAALAYIKDEAQFVVCDSGEWIDIEIGSGGESVIQGTNIFIDETNGNKYYVTETTQNLNNIICPTGWTLVLGQEVRDIIDHGLLSQIPRLALTPAGPRIWYDTSVNSALFLNNMTLFYAQTAAYTVCKD